MDEFLRHYSIITVNSLILLLIISLVITHKIITQIIISSILSLMLTIWYSLLNAPDVAMTEAAVNSAIGTLLSLFALKQIDRSQISQSSLIIAIISFIISVILFGQLWHYFVFGSSISIANQAIAHDYIIHTINDIGINSIVAAVLASYRGFDTLCETIVIFIAGLSVSCIMSINYQEN